VAVTDMRGTRAHRWPQVLPGGEEVLFTVYNLNPADADNSGINVASLRTGEQKTVHHGGFFAPADTSSPSAKIRCLRLRSISNG
jgi:hypothetical protein